MKSIFKLIINQNKEVEETEASKNDKGEEIKVIKKVTKPVPRTFIIKRPNRLDAENIEVFRAAAESEYIRRGVISATLLQRRLINDGGVLTDEQQKKYKELTESFFNKQPEYLEINNIPEKNRSKEQKQKLEQLLGELTDIMGQIQEIDNVSSSIYNRTAESLARNKATLYLTIMLSFEEKDEQYVPVFGEGNFEDKLKKYDEMEEGEDKFDYELIQKLVFAASCYYLGKASTQDEMDSLLAVQDKLGWMV